jgi:eukaryotic-like serine/threonine-protein kinase
MSVRADTRRPRLRLTRTAQRERRRDLVWGSLVTLAALAVTLAVVTAVVILLLGHGPAEVSVPNVVGQAEDEAIKQLENSGLEGKQTADVYSDAIAPGLVAKQRPETGMTVKEGRLVELTVSRGPRTVKVPDLKGKSQAEAEDAIAKAYLKVGRMRRQASAEPMETVLEQKPEAGATAERDAEVELTLSGGEDFGTWTGPEGERWVFKRLTIVVPAGVEMQRVRVTLDRLDNPVYDELHQPGDEISLDIHGRRGSEVKVYLEEKRVFEQELR